MAVKPRLLVISHVYPFPRSAGQQQRVYYKLRAFGEYFHITFLGLAEPAQIELIRKKLLETCDEAIVLPQRYSKNRISRIYHRLLGGIYAVGKSLKFSNYLIGKLEFSPGRVRRAIKDQEFDLVLYEYWHAVESTGVFQARGIPTVLDMHDILWRSYAHQLDARRGLPNWLKQVRIKQYQAREESAWRAFDMLITINQDEHDYVRRVVGDDKKFFYAPMGTDISEWLYSWEPAQPPRIAYYGDLGSRHNQQDAMLCYREIMPVIWEQLPDVEYWIVGNNPPGIIKDLEHDKRVHVTGFVEKPQEVLKTMSLVLCPWSGTYGFRSRVVEVMALGVPVIASTEAVQGMGFEVGCGIFLGKSSPEMAILGLELIHDASLLSRQSLLARRQMEEKFSYEATYVKLAAELANILRTYPKNAPAAVLGGGDAAGSPLSG